MTPLPRAIARSVSFLILIAWAGTMAALVNRSYLQASSNLATDLARYGSEAQWRGIYYRGEKIGFSVSQVAPTNGGFEIHEDGRLQMRLLGATTAARVKTTAQVDASFGLQSFEFSLDPGTGATIVQGRLDESGSKLTLTIQTPTGTRTDERTLAARPILPLNLPRQLASRGLHAGARHEFLVFDPATLSNAPMRIEVGAREIVRAHPVPVPAFRVTMEFAGLRTTSWVTDTGEVIREESPLGLLVVREAAETAQTFGTPQNVRNDLLRASAIVPLTKERIDEPRDVRRLRLRLDGLTLPPGDLDGVGQRVEGNVIELRDPRTLEPGPADPAAADYLTPEPFIESDAPEIRAEAERALRGVAGASARAERLTRHVNALLEKKPTVSLPSAREVLRTRVGDCNEHTALYVALARAAGIPARIAVGLVHMYGAFYYHAWPEVYIDAGSRRGFWLPVDPTLNQFPADATHLRLARGSLDKQAAILPLIGQLKMTILDLELVPGASRVLVGRPDIATAPALPIPVQRREARRCWFDALFGCR